MNMTKWILTGLLAVALAPVGCSKQDSEAGNQPPAVSINVPMLRAAFSTASPDIKALSEEAVRGIASANYAVALPAMEKLATVADLTDAQKQAVAEVTAQVKQMAARAAAAPAPQ